jgi:Protein of unknown function (DUF3225)
MAGLKINDPAVLADLTATFRRYDPALLAGDTARLNELFWKSPATVRFGITENLYGHDEIAHYRKRSSKVAPRQVTREVITTYGEDFGTTNVEYLDPISGRRGRQTQTWLRTPEGWRIVSAHVSMLTETK